MLLYERFDPEGETGLVPVDARSGVESARPVEAQETAVSNGLPAARLVMERAGGSFQCGYERAGQEH